MNEEKKDEELKETQQATETAETASEPNQDTQEEEKQLTTEEQLEAANTEIASLKDQLLRKIAEFDNYRKRTIKEKTELILNGGEKTIVSILPVIDDMERALKNMKSAEDVNAVVEGVELIYNKFKDILTKEGVEEIPAKGEKFDLNKHEALMVQESDDVENGYVIEELMKGYMYKDKVLKYSKVIVCKK